MTITEMLLDSVQYVVDNKGQKTAVLFDLAMWQELRPLLDELIEDGRLGQLMAEVADDERLEGEEALQAYQAYLSESSS
jgi:hypothetical protein